MSWSSRPGAAAVNLRPQGIRRTGRASSTIDWRGRRGSVPLPNGRADGEWCPCRPERALRSLDLTAAQRNALQHVVWTPGISAAEIARRTGFTPQSVGAAVNALIDRGLLVRREHPSNRSTVRPAITGSGAKLAYRARELVERLDTEALAVLAPAELNPDALPPLDPRGADSGVA
ncbi:MarR family winged helix-turn-helix transcriptional regulator [Streptomyces sp. NPDC002680]|uniref:MarR family winged helix-turn-helix transcriptional regulator n=1 Tax=Streptomyces sp. NPDC002680 TaxID=3364659 RepID=UPI003684C0BE